MKLCILKLVFLMVVFFVLSRAAALSAEDPRQKANVDPQTWQKRVAEDPYYPRFHVAPPFGWMNDPHPVFFKGVYHVFYQYSFLPDQPYGGPHCWGHAASKDLTHWKHYPPAITPQDHGIAPDRHIYSGCLVDNDGVGTAIYTIENRDVWIATSGDDELARFAKYARNPVIKGPPPGLEIEGGMRDPWAWKEDDGWYMIIGSGIKGGRGPVLPLYRSTDLTDWEYLHPLYLGDPKVESKFCECPSFFQIGEKHVLALSHRASYRVGRYANHRFTAEKVGRLDYGQIYVPQFVFDDKGRTIMFGWAGGWGGDPRSREAQTKAGWTGMQTIPRVVSLGDDGRLRFEPAKELQALRREHQQLRDVSLQANATRVIDAVRGAWLEIKATIRPDRVKKVGIVLLDGSQTMEIAYHRQEKTVHLGEFTAPLPLEKDQALQLHVFVDGSVLEVFANRRVCLTRRFYPSQPEQLRVGLFARDGRATLEKLDAWTMGSHWVEKEARSK